LVVTVSQEKNMAAEQSSVMWMRAMPMDPALRQAIAEGNAKGLLGLS